MLKKFIVYLGEKDGKSEESEETVLHISDGSTNVNIPVPAGDSIDESEIVKFIQGLKHALVEIYEYRIKKL